MLGLQAASGVAAEFTDKQPLGLVVLDIIIALMASPAIGQPQFHPIVGGVNSAAKLLRVDEGFNHQNRMAILKLPILTEPIERQTQHPRTQIGHRTIRQNQETAVVDDQAEAPVALGLIPSNPLVPMF